MRWLPLILVAHMALAASVSAQTGADVDKRTKGGVSVKGWSARLDPKDEKAGVKLNALTFAEEAGGMRVTSGPAAIYWNPANKMKGTYSVRASFTQLKPSPHIDFYGLFIGGTDLGGAKLNYLYCVVTGSGVFVVKHRVGGEVHDLAARTAHPAIRKSDAAGKATNEVAWRVTPERTSCLVNGTEVWGYASKDLIGPGKLETLDGIAGMRVNHDLDVQVTGFSAR